MLEEQLYEIPLDEGYHRDDNIRTYSYQVALVVGNLTLKWPCERFLFIIRII